MEFQVTRSGAALIGFWVILTGAVVSIPFWSLNAVAALFWLAVWCVVCLCVLVPRWAS